MSRQVVRYGFVSKIGNGFLRVRLITEGENCSGCSVASFCGKGEEVEAPCPDASADMIGRRVRVIMISNTLSGMAATVTPVLILVGVAVGLLMAGVPDLWCVVSAFAAMSLWYLVSYLYYNGRIRVTSVDFIEHFPERACLFNDMDKGN